MKINKKFWASMAVGTLASGLFLSGPKILRRQIEKRLPGVEFKNASLSTSGVTLTGVTINRGWVSGTVDTVTSDFKGEHVLIDGGTLSLNLDDKPTGTGTSKKDIQVKNIDAHVSHTGHKITMNGVHTDGNKVCFSSANLEAPTITSGKGCYDREDHRFSLDRAELKELKISGAAASDTTATDITFDTQSKVAKVGTVTTKVTFEGQEFQVEASGVVASRKPDKVRLESLKVKHPWLASDWLDLGPVGLDHGDGWNLTVGASRVKVEPKTLTISGEEECGTWVDSLPPSLKSGPLSTVKMTGKTGFTVGFRPKPTFQLKSDCRARCDSLPNLRKSFRYTAYDPKGKPFERVTGRGTRGWYSLGMTGDMPLAVINMEDPGFDHHRGFIPQAFTNSFLENLKQGRFSRGGSTITMQLVKNIWLTREKTLGRKVQEFFLSQALESCYSKGELLELYLNVVEFGPNQYGVWAGSMFWFNRPPDELEPVESFWLASILPRPSKTGPPDELSLKRISSVMKTLSSTGKIPDYMVDPLEPGEETPVQQEE